MKRGIYVVVVLCLIIFLHGCASSEKVTKWGGNFYPSDFTYGEEKIPLKAGIYLTDEVRKYAVYGKWGATKMLVGEALETAAVMSLEKVFDKVSLFYNKNNVPQDIERIVAIEFGDATKEYPWGEQEDKSYEEARSTTELLYKVYDSKWNLLFQGKAVGRATEQFPKYKPRFTFFGGAAGGAMAGYEAGYHGFPQWGRVARRSLISALEQINDQILTLGKEAILKGK